LGKPKGEQFNGDKVKKFIVLLIVVLLPVSGIAKDWYVGGALHSANGLEWQEATYENKLATCSDFISKMWEGKNFKPAIQQKITTMDHIKVLSIELVRVIDGTFEKQADPELNRKAFVNQTVSETAVMLMVLMGWLQTDS
jgi:hypothetical protein